MNTSIIEIVKATSNSIVDDRTPLDIFTSLIEEVGELSTELAILQGHSTKLPGTDGIIDKTQIIQLVQNKCNKWVKSKEQTVLTARTARTLSYANVSKKVTNYLNYIFKKIIDSSQHGEFIVENCFCDLKMDNITLKLLVDELSKLGYNVVKSNNDVYSITWEKKL